MNNHILNPSNDQIEYMRKMLKPAIYAAGMLEEDFSALCGFPRQSICRMITGKLQPLSFNNAFDICAMEEIIADDGNTILGYKEIDWDDVEDWDKLYVSFDILEWEVE